MGKVNWQRLEDILAEVRNKPFCWGVHDCTILADRILLEVAGVDLLGELRGTWSTQEEAEAIIEPDFAASVDRWTGWPRVPVRLAHRLDLMMTHIAGRQQLGVNVGGSIAVPGRTRLLLAPTRYAIAAWRTPHV